MTLRCLLNPWRFSKNHIFTHPVLLPIAHAHNKSVAQVVLRWLIQRGIVVIPKSVKPERMSENFDVFNFSLSDEEMRSIQSLDTGKTLFAEHTDPERIRTVATRKFNT
ncbi:aldo/keto reductase [Kluyvera sp. CHPC 1.2972]|uniref:aldo/keto reductase n=1 Tax=Kluyvera sp. CHPC 1.2972 TaxID=2995176 RepID=UPI002FD7CE79